MSLKFLFTSLFDFSKGCFCMCRYLFFCPDCLCRKRYDASIKDLEKKQDAHREVLAKLQHQFQQAQVKAAAKA